MGPIIKTSRVGSPYLTLWRGKAPEWLSPGKVVRTKVDLPTYDGILPKGSKMTVLNSCAYYDATQTYKGLANANLKIDGFANSFALNPVGIQYLEPYHANVFEWARDLFLSVGRKLSQRARSW
jgi:hypothetical protein